MGTLFYFSMPCSIVIITALLAGDRALLESNPSTVTVKLGERRLKHRLAFYLPRFALKR